MMNNYNSLSLGFSSYLKKWSSSSVGSPPTITVHEKQKLTQSFGVMSFMFLALVFLGLFSSSAIAQTTLLSSSGNGGFENGATFALNNWTAVTGSVDGWEVGTTAPPGVSAGTNSAYVSTNLGVTWAYSQLNTIEHIYTDVTIPAGESLVTLTFKWKAGGEGTTTSDWDNMKVFWGPAININPAANTALTANQVSGAGATSGMYKLSSATYNSETIVLSGIPGVTYRLVFSWKSDVSDIVNPPAAIDEVNLVSSVPSSIASIQGGLWNSPATWTGGVVPTTGSNVTITAGHIVTVNQNLSLNNLTVAGTLQYGPNIVSPGYATVLSGKFTIDNGGRFLHYNTGLGFVQGVTIAGDFENNGFANCFISAFTFNGVGSTVYGTGTFLGDGIGSRGIIRTLSFISTGANTINTSQNLVSTSGLNLTAGSLNTNGKLTIDNTVQLYGQPLNLSVANIVVDNMGTLYNVQPVVFGSAVVQYANALATAIGTRYVSGGNVYVCTTAAPFNATAPTFTTPNTLDSSSGPTLLYIGAIGTLGTSAPYNSALALGTNYFYGGNLYQAVATAASTTMPTHISGTVGSYRYIGTPASASVNWDVATGTVRSLTLTNAGTGLTVAPTALISVGVAGGTGSGATAIAVYIQRFAAVGGFLVQKTTGTPVSGGLTINSDQGASMASGDPQASSGVGNVSTSNGGVNYTVAPVVGFAGPPALNLITNPGAGYVTAPTVTVTGGNLVSGTALATANFTITVNSGVVESVYLNTATTATYSTPPTLTLTGGTPTTTATLAFPAGCWPAATANIGSNGQLTSFTMTNNGYGYAAAPIVGVGITSGSANGGTFTTVATAPTCAIASYTLTCNFFAPSTIGTLTAQADDAFIPTSRKMLAMNLNGNGMGINLANNLTLFGTAPLTLAASGIAPGNVIDLGGFNLNCSWNGYTGTTSTFGSTNAYIKGGSMTLTGRGGAGTLNFPFSGTFTLNRGTTPTAVTTGSSVTRVTVSDTSAPSNSTPGLGFAIGSRAFRLQYSSGVMGTLPTVTMNFNSVDGLTVTQDLLYVAESASLSGAWNNKSTAYGVSGALPATGSKVTATVAPGPIAPTGNTYYAWSTVPPPSVTSVSPTTMCASSGAFTITGTDFSSVTSVTIGGTPVSSFVIVSPTQITGVAGPGTSGTLTVTSGAGSSNGPIAITLLPVPVAPSVSAASATVAYGVAPSITASGTETTFNWYNVATGGSPIFTGATFNSIVCASGSIYVAQTNGTCEGPRTAVAITVSPVVIAATVPKFCGTGGSTTLSITPVAGATYAWTKLTPSASFTSGTTSASVNVTVTETSDFQLVVTGPGACSTTVFYSVSVYALPTATVTTTANGVCPLTSATINSGLTASNFISSVIPFAPRAPVGAVTLAGGGAIVVPMSGTPSLDDGGWGAIPIGFNFSFFGTTYTTVNVGTNAVLQFGAFNNNGGFTLPYGLADFTFTTLPSVNEPLSIVALLANDNHFTNLTIGGGTLSYWTEGISPNRKFVVDYNAVRQWNSTTNTSTSQAIFYETTGIVEVHVTGSTSTNNKVVGINNATGTTGALALATTAVISTPVAYRFTPPYNYTTVWTADEGEGPVEIANGTNVFTQSVSPTTTTTYTISYTNQTTGCTNALNSAQVIMTVLGTTPPAGVTTLSSQSILCPGTTTTNLSLGNLASVDGLTFQWQQDTGAGFGDISGATASTYVATPGSGTTSYRAQIKSCGGTASNSAPVSVLVPVVTPLTLSSNTASYCAGGSATVTVTSGAAYYSSFTWSPATVTGTAGTGFTFTAPGTYTLTAGAPVNGCPATAQVIVTENPVAATPTVTPASPIYNCGSPGTLLSVGTSYTNPTPSGFCLNNTSGQYPGTASTPTACDGVTATLLPTNCWAGEHSLINVTSNSLYTFSSSLAGDIVEITATDGTTVLAYGPSPVQWFNNIAATQVRFYTQIASCTSELVSRQRSYVCLSSPTAVFAPATGLYNDAAGTSPYNGTTAVTQVYARPTATQAYTAVSNNGFNCPSPAANVTVTVPPCNSIVNLKLFIEAYVDGAVMRSVKNNQDGSSPLDEVEDITVELHNATTPFAMVYTTTATLKTDGTAVCTFPPAASGSYYIAVTNSNALETWSATPQTVGSTPLPYDFSTAANKAFEDNMIDVGGLWSFYSGDINQDDVIDGTDATDLDLDVFNSNSGVLATDLNGDGTVDGSDVTYYENNQFNSVFAHYPQ